MTADKSDESLFPRLSILDLDEKPEGSLDPLGTYAIADELASRLASPGVRERQSNIRFLTLCSIGWSLLAEMDSTLMPGDPGSAREQAFEWLIVEALVKGRATDADDGIELSVPGMQKAQDCVSQGLPLNADRYLRTPGTFGFFGVYRSLANYLRVASPAGDGTVFLNTNGERLLQAWKKDTGFRAFGPYGEGSGRKEFSSLLNSLQETWKEGQTPKKHGAGQFIRTWLHPNRRPGKEESKVLLSLLKDEGRQAADENRKKVLECLALQEGRAIVDSKDAGMERRFHRFVRSRSTDELRQLLDAIDAYEGFIGPLTDAFDGLRRCLGIETRLVELSGRAATSMPVKKAARSASAKFGGAFAALELVGLSAQFNSQFGGFSTPFTATDFAFRLMDHHEGIQRKKPPMGKASWFDRQGSKIGLRPLYRIEAEPRDPEGYVHSYRTRPLHRFLSVLEK
jgi:hypothetical protein